MVRSTTGAVICRNAVFHDASRAEGVATDLRLDAGVGRAPTDHAVHVGLSRLCNSTLAASTA